MALTKERKMKQPKWFEYFKDKLTMVIFVMLTVFLFSVYQNCAQPNPSPRGIDSSQYPGSASNSVILPNPTPTPTATNTASSNPTLSASSTSYTFPNPTGNTEKTFTITNTSSYPAYNVQAIFGLDLTVFSVTYNTCNGISLPAGQTCQVKLNYSNPTINNYSGWLYISYANGSYVAMPIVAISVNGPGVNSGAYQTSPVYRFTYGSYTAYSTMTRHFYTKTYNEGISAGFTYEGIAFYVYTNSGAPGTVALYRCLRNPNSQHFLSTSSTCEGHTVESIMGYVYTSSQYGNIPLYRYYSSTAPDYFHVTSLLTVLFNGYTLQNTSVYVLPQ